jgi:hypothetical protein
VSLDAHCGIGGCSCSHDGECYKGWLDRREDGWEYTVPCRRCKPQQRRVTQEAPSREAMGQRLRERAMSKQWTGGGA